MEVLLLQDVEALGQAGDIKRVADGYARNYLIPRQMAVLATPGAIKQAEARRQAADRREVKELDEAKALAERLDGVTVSFLARAGETDRLYGSITNVAIAEALEKEIGQEVDRRKIELEEPLKELGTHAVTVKLAAEAEAKVTVVIEREEDSIKQEEEESAESDEEDEA
jgi:large subunit ribosomal protein L9